jgi:hypothetical protein
MAHPRFLLTSCASFALLLAAGCGKPEDARVYMGGGSAPASVVAEVKTPPPPVPVSVTPFMGRNLKAFSKGMAVCKGMLDTVTRRHTGARPGAEIEGWGWDERGARPLTEVLFTDPGGKVVGGATVGNPRPDVPKAMPEVKTPNVGWRGVADVATDQLQAVGVTAAGDTCVIGQTNLG